MKALMYKSLSGQFSLRPTRMIKMQTKIFLLVLLAITSLQISAKENITGTKSLYWIVKNPTWTPEFERSYQNFIHTLGVARKNGACHTVDQCLRSPVANPQYFNMNPRRLKNIFSDCADLPFVLRTYFSWMNDLPFSYATELVEATSGSSNKSDIRYSKYGNIVTAKRTIYGGDNINEVLSDVVDSISSASFRTDASKNDSGYLFRDTYPVDIDRKYIVPGTMVYDPNGHVAIVYDVTTTGQIYLIDSHPDNTMTTLIYGEKFARSKIRTGGGFSNFRPFSVARGNVVPKKNSELPGYSLIQFQTSPFIFKGQTMTYYEYVRAVLADGDIIYDPISEFSNYMDELCQDIKDREEAVNIAIKDNVDDRYHPDTLPVNIYGADGDWEIYSTSARDARLKASVRETKIYLTKVLSGYTNFNLKIKFSGDDLASQLREIYLSKANSCTIMATPRITLNLDTVLVNLFSLSFDPYHCAQLRWGITGENSCLTSNNKMKWFKAEQGLRNRVDRDYSIKTDYDVYTLPSAPASQVEMPDLSFDQLLNIPR